jgi:hypothetical protein
MKTFRSWTKRKLGILRKKIDEEFKRLSDEEKMKYNDLIPP